MGYKRGDEKRRKWERLKRQETGDKKTDGLIRRVQSCFKKENEKDKRKKKKKKEKENKALKCVISSTGEKVPNGRGL